MLDLLITGGSLIDGTGAPARPADIGIRDGRIVAVAAPGSITEAAHDTIDATGLVVAPGFIDVHTHLDAQLLWDPTGSPSLQHGCSTVVCGNCGFSLAPAGPEHAEYLTLMLSRVESMPLDALRTAIRWTWSSFEQWLAQFDGNLAINAGFLVGHSALRRAVLGDDFAKHDLTADERARLLELVRASLDAGALGFSTSLSTSHVDGQSNPVPSRYTTDDELLAIADVVREHEAPVMQITVAGTSTGFQPDEVELLTQISLRSDRPINWNVLMVRADDRAYLERQLAASDHAAAKGAKVLALTPPNSNPMRMSFATGAFLYAIPGWAALFALTPAERIEALRDPAWREKLQALAQAPEAGVIRGRTQWHLLTLRETRSPRNAEWQGRTFGEIAAARGVSAFDAMLDIVIDDELQTGIEGPPMHVTDADWALRSSLLRDPRVIVGGSDAGAHLDMFVGATYTTSMLSEVVRERGLLPLEDAVHLITDVPARLYGLRDRGRVAEGWIADLTVFDPRTVGNRPAVTVHDLPGGSSRLVAEATGIPHVVVNGVPVLRDGAVTGAHPGTTLRTGRDTERVSLREATG
jgi:N-acyl-D-aspartate/D-glutamate deacylase